MQNVEHYLLPEWGGLVWEPSIPILTETMKTVQRHFFPAAGVNSYTSHSHCGFGKSKQLMQHEEAPSERRWVLTCKMYAASSNTTSLSTSMSSLKGEENKKEKESWAAVRRTYISSWLLHGEACSASFLPWLGFKVFPVLLETKGRENLPTQIWKKPNIQCNVLVNEA